VEVRQPRVSDRRLAEEAEKFSSKVLPPYLRKTKAVEKLIPRLYLKWVSTGDLSEALAALLGPAGPRAGRTRAAVTWSGSGRRAPPPRPAGARPA
jgi:hypothetical protein